MKSLTITTKINIYSFSECPKEKKKLIDSAKNATQMAYAPYSNFRVGAAILLSTGEIITGNNQENAAYPSGLCAERTALFYTMANYSNTRIEAIAIAAFDQDQFTKLICPPCGACRQSILEAENFFKQNIRIIMYGKELIYEAESIKDLLPLSFGNNYL